MQDTTFQNATAPKAIEIAVDGRTLSDVIKAAEAAYLGHALTQAGGNKTAAAKIAGLAPETMRRKLQLYEIRAVFHVG